MITERRTPTNSGLRSFSHRSWQWVGLLFSILLCYQVANYNEVVRELPAKVVANFDIERMAQPHQQNDATTQNPQTPDKHETLSIPSPNDREPANATESPKIVRAPRTKEPPAKAPAPSATVIAPKILTLNDSIVYTFPASGTPDKIPLQRVMSAFSKQEEPPDSGREFVLGNDCPITSKITISRNDLLVPSSSLETSKYLLRKSTTTAAATTTSSKWILSTWDIHGTPKHVGGDDIYVTYTASGETQPIAIANVTDLGNGNYSLQFVISPTIKLSTHLIKGNDKEGALIKRIQNTMGRLEIWLEQSCSIGSMQPPLKNAWNTSGAINQFYQMDPIPAPQYVQKFIPPNYNGAIDFASFDQVALLGDSLMGHFVCAENYIPTYERCATFRQHLYKSKPLWTPLNSQTLQQFFDRIQTDIPQAYQEALLRRQTESQQKQSRPLNIAVVLGSGVWDIIADDTLQGGENFVDHLAACRALITSTRAQFPNVTIYWKSMTAMHIHKVAENENWESIKRVFYMSNSRSHQLYTLQLNLMKELNVTVLDVYPMTALSAHWTRSGDGRHYQTDFNRFVLEWFYPKATPPPNK